MVHGLAARACRLNRYRQIFLTLACPINSLNRCGRSFNSNEESSSTGAADTKRSRLASRLRLFLAVATLPDSTTSAVPHCAQPEPRLALRNSQKLNLAVTRAQQSATRVIGPSPVSF